MRKYVSTKWLDLGLELLEQEDEEALYEIKSNHNNDSECCREMFQLWLNRCVSAKWDHLIRALKEVDLNPAAAKIEEMLTPMEDTDHTLLHANEGTFMGQILWCRSRIHRFFAALIGNKPKGPLTIKFSIVHVYTNVLKMCFADKLLQMG